MSNTRKTNCKTIHVKGHADRKKRKGELTEHEHLNITTDHIAEQIYSQALEMEREHGSGYYHERAEVT